MHSTKSERGAALAPRIVDALVRDYDMRLRKSGASHYLRSGKCPACGQKELWASAESPWVIRCGRLNNCGYEASAKDLYPDLYGQLSKLNPPTAQDPKATARAYLRDVRGLETLSIDSWYTQESWYSPAAQKGTQTVRFALPGLRGVFFERFIDPVAIPKDGSDKPELRRANFIGSYQGHFWQPPSLPVASDGTVYIVEGILDAIALIQSGQPAVAALSCNNFPLESIKLFPQSQTVVWVWAFDNDPAGRRFAKKYHAKLSQLGYQSCCALAPQRPRGGRKDWNDLLLDGSLAQDKLQATLAQARYQGKQALCESATAKAVLIHLHKKLSTFWFEFDSRLFWFAFDHAAIKKVMDVAQLNGEALDTSQAIERAGLVKEIANCHPECLYHEVSTVNDEMNRYYLRIRTPDGRSTNAAFSGPQLASASEFKKRLLSISAGAMYLGSNSQLDTYLLRTLKNLSSVQVFDAVGYSDQHQAYIYHQLAVKDGRVYEANAEDYILLGRDAVKTASGLHLSLAQHIHKSEWLQWIAVAWGAPGIVCAAYWIASLCAQQIRAISSSFPFLELVGEAGGGKSTLLEFLWKLLGRDGWEGFDPNKASYAALNRNFAQVSNLPIVLIESDREDDYSKKFAWDSLKTAYNGRIISSRGVKTGGNEVYEPPFRGALVISQNARVEGSEPIMQRIVGVTISRATHTSASAEAVTHINNCAVRDVSGVLLHTITRAQSIMSLYAERLARYKNTLAQAGVTIARLALNHAQIAVFLDVLKQHFGLSAHQHRDALQYLTSIALERQDMVGADPPTLVEFWDMVEFLRSIGLHSSDDEDVRLNHSANAGEIAINLNHIQALAGRQRLTMPAMRDIKRLLPLGRRYKYTGQAVIKSAIWRDAAYGAKSVRCWMFKKASSHP